MRQVPDLLVLVFSILTFSLTKIDHYSFFIISFSSIYSPKYITIRF